MHDMLERWASTPSPFSDLRYSRNSSSHEANYESYVENGINCLGFVRLYLDSILGSPLLMHQPEFTGKFLYENEELCSSVPESGPFINGDVFLFGRVGLTDWHKLHLAVFAGDYTENGDPLLLHATNYSVFCKDKPEGGVFCTPLARMMRQRQWQVLYGVRRWKL